MRVLVTGATGFIGSRVSRILAAEGHVVCGMTRSPEGAQRLLVDGIQPLVGDLREPSPRLAALLRAAAPDLVLHLAAEIATQRNEKRLWEVDVEGTRRLLAAFAEVPPARLIYAGTVVVGDAHGELLREDRPLVASTAYGRAKLEAERLCFDSGRALGMGVTSLRPSHVYGPGGWFAAIARDLRRGRFFLPGAGNNLWDLVHVDDVAEAFAAAVRSPEAAAGQVFHVVDDEPMTMREFLDAAAHALGAKRPRSVPVWVAKIWAGRGPVAAAVRSARSSNAKIKERLGWRPRYPGARLALTEVARLLSGNGPPPA
jgi:nucleoside-diphosphate-sugar epimerase